MGDRLGGGEAGGRSDLLHVLHNAQLLTRKVEKQGGRLSDLDGDGVGAHIAVFGGDEDGEGVDAALQRHLAVALYLGLGVGGGGGEGELVGVQRQGEGVVRDGGVKGGGQLAGADGEGGEGIVGAAGVAGGLVLAAVGLVGRYNGDGGAAYGVIIGAVDGVGAAGDAHGGGAGTLGAEDQLVDPRAGVKAVALHHGDFAGLQSEIGGVLHVVEPHVGIGGHGDGKGHGLAHADGALAGGHGDAGGQTGLRHAQKQGADGKQADSGFLEKFHVLPSLYFCVMAPMPRMCFLTAKSDVAAILPSPEKVSALAGAPVSVFMFRMCIFTASRSVAAIRPSPSASPYTRQM